MVVVAVVVVVVVVVRVGRGLWSGVIMRSNNHRGQSCCSRTRALLAGLLRSRNWSCTTAFRSSHWAGVRADEVRVVCMSLKSKVALMLK